MKQGRPRGAVNFNNRKFKMDMEMRKCLSCQKKFPSPSRFIRMCEICKRKGKGIG